VSAFAWCAILVGNGAPATTHAAASAGEPLCWLKAVEAAAVGAQTGALPGLEWLLGRPAKGPAVSPSVTPPPGVRPAAACMPTRPAFDALVCEEDAALQGRHVRFGFRMESAPYGHCGVRCLSPLFLRSSRPGPLQMSPTALPALCWLGASIVGRPFWAGGQFRRLDGVLLGRGHCPSPGWCRGRAGRPHPGPTPQPPPLSRFRSSQRGHWRTCGC
jgi:hypothetical protein